MKNPLIILAVLTLCLLGSTIYFASEVSNQKSSNEQLLTAAAEKDLALENVATEKQQLVKTLTESALTVTELKENLTSVQGNLTRATHSLTESKREASLLQLESERIKSQLSGSTKQIFTLNNELNDAIQSSESTHIKLVEQLKNEIGKQDIKIQEMGGKLKLSLSNKILFASAKTTLTAEGLTVLERLGHILKGVDNKIIRVEGHTDNVKIRYRLQDKFPTNWELSASRATNVVRFLIDKVGVDPKKVYAVGMSKYHPIGDNNNIHGRSLNRRIEIMLEDVINVQEIRELQLVSESDVSSINNASETLVQPGIVTSLASSNEFAGTTLDPVITSVNSDDVDSLEEPEVIIGGSGGTTSTHSTEIKRQNASKSVKKPFSYSTGQSQSGVGYIWVKKRITDFDNE